MFRKKNPPIGSRPGTFIIDSEAAPPKVRVLAYSADRLDEYGHS